MKNCKSGAITLITIISSLAGLSCTPKEINPCGTDSYNESATLLASTYIFWMDADYGQLVVEVKDSQGRVATPIYKTIDQYYINVYGPIQDCSTSTQEGNAVYLLATGTDYSYTARNYQNTFTGTLDLTCQDSDCNYIKISSKTVIRAK